MHTLEAARQLIADMAPHADDIDEIHEGEAGHWGFGFADDAVMTAEWAAMPPRLVLTFFLGAPPPERHLEACELLLRFNQLGAETGGVRGGLASDGDFTLMHDLPAAPLGTTEFRDAVLDFAALGRRWRRALQGRG